MRKLAVFTAAFSLSAAVFVYCFAQMQAIWIAVGGIALALIARFVGMRRVSIAGLGIAVGILWCLCYQQIWMRDLYVLDDTDQVVSVRIMQSPYKTAYGTAAECKLGRYRGVIYGDHDLLRAQVGDTVRCSARISSQTDDRDSLADGTLFQLRPNGDIEIIDGKPNVYEAFRLWTVSRIDALYDQPARGFVKALLTGARYDISYETNNMLSVSGLSHAIAVSGMHISILLTVIAMLCGYQPKLMAVIGIPAALLFALASGASPSVCRASVMQIMLVCAPIARRERDAVTSLAAAALLLLTQNPWCIADISFQMSFAAVLGLIVFSGPIQKRILSCKEKPGKALRFFASGVSATLSATLTTLPLVVLYFQIVSIVAVLVNLLTLWAVSIVFTFGICSCILGPVGIVPAWITSVLCRYILGICKVMSFIPYAAVYQYNQALQVCAVFGYFLFVAAMLFKKLSLRWTGSIVCLSFALCALFTHLEYHRPPWRMTVLDVGQGQCIVLRIGDYTAVVDCGGKYPEAAGENAARYLHGAGVTRIDAMILTHYDADHAGGAVQFLSRVKTDHVFLPPAPEDEQMDDLIEETGCEVKYITSGLQIRVPDGTITIYPPVSNENANNSGITILATAQEYDMLITGDLDEDAEMKLVRNWDLPDVGILVAGHHGARSSTSDLLLQITKPEIAVISAGAGNRYGHPHKETLDKLEKNGIRILRTDLHGTITITP